MNRFSRRRVLLLLVLTSVILITVDSRSSSAVKDARTAFAYVFRPFKDMARVVTRPLGNAWRGMIHYGDLERENLALRDELARQAGNAAAAEAFVREHEELLTLSQLPIAPDISTVVAQVIGGAPRSDQQTVEINQGSNRGLRVGMPVVNGAGLIGKVTEVFPDGAVVRLITDPQYALAVRITCAAALPGVVTGVTTTTQPAGVSGVTGVSGPTDSAPNSAVTTTTTTTTPTPASGPTGPSGAAPLGALCDRETGSIRGQGANAAPDIGLLNDDALSRSITVGDQVFSAGGTESLAPPNLPIGRVSKVMAQLGSAPTVQVKLNADLGQLNFVEVLLYLPAAELAN